LEVPPNFKAYPFKLNPQWLLDSEFDLMVQALWNEPKYLGEESKQKRLMWKLKDLKDKTKHWQKLCYQQASAHLKGMEMDISALLQESLEGVITTEKELLLKAMEQEQNRLLYENEERWRQQAGLYGFRAGIKIQIFFIILQTSGAIKSTFGRLWMKRETYIQVKITSRPKQSTISNSFSRRIQSFPFPNKSRWQRNSLI
jgi:hypothetical protein